MVATPTARPVRAGRAAADGGPSRDGSEGVAWVERLRGDLKIPSLGAYGLGRPDVDDLVSAATRASSMRGNPIALDATELRDVLLAAI